MDKRTAGLSKHSAEKKEAAQTKALQAIDDLKQAERKVTVSSVSKQSGISRTTLYDNPTVMERIEESQVERKEAEAQSTQKTIESLRSENDRLKEEKKMLVIQLVEMDRIVDENKRLKAALDQVKRE